MNHPQEVHIVGCLGSTTPVSDIGLAHESNHNRCNSSPAADFVACMNRFAKPSNDGTIFVPTWYAGAELDCGDLKLGDHPQKIEIRPPHDLALFVFIAAAHKAVTLDRSVPLIIVLCGHGEPGTGRLIPGHRAGDHTFLSKEVLEEALGSERRSAINTFVVTSACISARWKSSMWTHYCAAGETSVSASDILWGAARHIEPDQGPTCADSIALPLTASTNSVSANLRQLNADEKAELKHLADLATRHHVETPSSWPILRESRVVLEQGVDAIRPGVQRDLLFRLRRWYRDCMRVNAIAAYMKWDAPAPAEEWDRAGHGKALRDAEDAGVPIHSEFFFEKNFRLGRWSIAPGTWLADAWARAGKPSVSEGKWAAAIASCPM